VRVVCPDRTVCEVAVPGVLTKVKVGEAATQAVKRLPASTEPRPLTRL
jgi:hypothetical protein